MLAINFKRVKSLLFQFKKKIYHTILNCATLFPVVMLCSSGPGERIRYNRARDSQKLMTEKYQANVYVTETGLV